MKKITILSIPGSLKNNPYLELLYAQVRGEEFQVETFSARALLALLFVRTPVIVHIHWETNIYGSRYWIYSVYKLCTAFPFFFFTKIGGVRFVWTMHNLHAHDFPFPRLDAIGRFCIRILADVIIIQNKKSSEEFSLRFPEKKIVYIPHGNYIGVYGSRCIRNAGLRAAYKLPETGPILIALGAIRPYKNLEMLIDAVESPVTLYIAGKGEAAYIQELQTTIAHRSNIYMCSEFVPNEKISELFAAVDYAIFAHGDSSLTSGSILLALSYGVPVITLSMPAAEIIKEGNNGFVLQDEQELKKLLKQLPTIPVPNADEVIATVTPYSWDRVGAETRAAYHSIL